MGEVIQFPGDYHSRKADEAREYSPEEIDVLEIAHSAVKDALRKATIETGTLRFGPQLVRQADRIDNWTITPLRDESEGPNLTVV